LGDTAFAVEFRLTSLKIMLDTMRVKASRLYSADGFEERRKRGFGVFFYSAEVNRIHAFEATALLKTINGVRIVGAGIKERILMESANKYCEPTIVVDGVQLQEFTAADLNGLVMPEEIVGMEVYRSPGSVPVQFKGMSHDSMLCGAVVVWTRR